MKANELEIMETHGLGGDERRVDGVAGDSYTCRHLAGVAELWREGLVERRRAGW